MRAPILVDDRIVQDEWVRPGGVLREVDFQRMPSTELAREAFARRDLQRIKREHIVPRAQLLRIVFQTVTVDDTKRVIAHLQRAG